MNRTLTLSSLLAIGTIASDAFAQCATQVVSPTVAMVCPAGDIPITATFLDAGGSPCPGEVVLLDLGPAVAAGLWLAPGQAAIVPAVTSLSGVASFVVNAGGCVPASGDFLDVAGNVLGATPPISSPDIDGDGRSVLQDLVLFHLMFLTPDVCGDHTGDGLVSLGDFVNHALHFLHQ